MGKGENNKIVPKLVAGSVFALLSGKTAAVEVTDDLKNFETFDGLSCVTKQGWNTDGLKNSVYPETMEGKIPFQGEELDIKLRADRDIFADDWELIDAATDTVISNDKEAYMCH